MPDETRHWLPHQETGEAHYEGDGCPVPGNPAVEAARRAVDRVFSDPYKLCPHDDDRAAQDCAYCAADVAVAAALPHLREQAATELARCEGDLAVAVHEATTARAQRQAVLDLCNEADRVDFSVRTYEIRAALGVTGDEERQQ